MKKSLAVVLALSVGLFLAFIIDSLRVFAQTNITTNATTYSLVRAERLDTFSAQGAISSLIFDTGTGVITSPLSSTATNTNGNQSHTANNQNNRMMARGTSTTTNQEEKPPYVLSGDWNLKVERGKVKDFMAKFTMVRIDGTERHMHELTNFKTDNNSDIQLDPTNITFIKGTSDITTNGIDNWRGIDIFLLINKLKVISIIPSSHKIDDHFKGQPIYGVAEWMKDKNGNQIIISPNYNMTANNNGNMLNLNADGIQAGKLNANKTGKTANTNINNSSLESLYKKFFGSS